MANRHQTTFRAIEVDERFKKLERSLKLALLKQKHNKDLHDVKASPTKVTSWPSISSINVDSIDSNCTILSPTSPIRSEVLASSNNLRNILLRKKSHNTKPAAMTTSRVNRNLVQQDIPNIDRHIMPPPLASTVYRTPRESHSRVPTLSNCEKVVLPSFNNTVQSSMVDTISLVSIPSWMSANTNSNLNTFDTPATSVNINYKIDQVFTKWKVMLNNEYELLIKGTLNCGRVARSKPVIRRYSAICVESKYKHKYILQGNIADEKNALPDYIRGKFYNGFPDDWENVYQIWRTYVSQGCPVVFRWPTRITDSDDDLKTELTDLTYTCSRNKKATSAAGSCNLNKHPKTEDQKYKSNTFEKKEKSHNSLIDNSQNYEKNISSVKSFISNSERDIIPVVQTRHIKSLCNDENKQDVKSDINLSNSSKKIKNTLKDILQEDKLNIIINNLTDKNCSPKYIEKIIEMFDCLDYVVSYKTESECNNDSVSFISHETSKPETIPMQQNLVCNNSRTNINKLENKPMELRSKIQRNNVDTYGHSTDLGYGSLKIDFNTIQLSNSVNANKSENDKNSDLSESETYAGVPKISFKRVLKARRMPTKICRRKMKKKPDGQKCATNLSDSNFDGNGGSKIVTQNKQLAQQSNFDIYGEGKSVMQNKQPSDICLDNQKVNLNVFIKEQKIPHRIQKETYSSFVADVDYTMSSDTDVITVSSNTRRSGGSTITSHGKGQDVVISSESNSNLLKRSLTSPILYNTLIDQTKNDTAIKKAKPTIISSMPVNLNLRISTASSKEREKVSRTTIATKSAINDNRINSYSKTIVGNKKEINPITNNKNKSNISIATKPTINDFHSNTTDANNKKEITNNKDKLDNKSSNNPNSLTNSIAEQPKSSKLGTKENPRVLTAWVPKVVQYTKSQSGLIFQGKLINEAGHVVNRKFSTNIVLRRQSATLIETVNHEFYALHGHLSDKHNIPKKLVKQCRYGCPAKIEQFCQTWRMQCDNVQEFGKKLYDATMNSLNTPVSSRGRHIVPPLHYWAGERITLKDNTVVYSPGSLKKSSVLTDNSKEIQKNTMNSEKKKEQKVNSKKQSVNKQILLPESNKTSNINQIVIENLQTSKKSPKTKGSTNNTRRFNKKSRKNNKQGAHKFSSTESSEEEQKTSPRKRVRNSKTNENADPETRYSMELRKRPKIETTSNKILRKDTTKSNAAFRSRTIYTPYHSSIKKPENHEITYTFHKNILQSEDFLSESEVSCI
ncbi:MATH and LRR domain-containing protein PFE0570w isoform X2 [Solenopsis invicta]|uniref:MATH and LRR domain-containing protein PFE0570w isoform X2 n=1 Tax=Solenopsis invicta TaxID=13686 RepID=UPI00193E31CD|nr:MATH and LRR domain-containing protein PFE0570w isoform X2 [Solenopsis invicta]